jgi:hypothetical protein
MNFIYLPRLCCSFDSKKKALPAFDFKNGKIKTIFKKLHEEETSFCGEDKGRRKLMYGPKLISQQQNK